MEAQPGVGDMEVLTKVLLWLHFFGLTVGAGGGLGLSQTGPRLIKTGADGRALLWTLHDVFHRMAGAGLVVMVITGAGLAWTAFGGVNNMPAWFWVKIAFIAIALVAFGVNHRATARFRRGEERAARAMMISGPLTGLSVQLAVLSAVLAFG